MVIARCWMIGLDRNIRTARFQRCKNADNGLRRALHRDGNAYVGANAELDQTMCKSVGALVEPAMAPDFVGIDDGCLVRRACRMGGDVFVHGTIVIDALILIGGGQDVEFVLGNELDILDPDVRSTRWPGPGSGRNG